MGRPLIDLTSKTFGRWTVKSYAGKDKSGHTMWLADCSCGDKNVTVLNLQSGSTRSCGCLRREVITTHGHRGKRSKEYEAWRSMHKRADNHDGKHPTYALVKVCKRWLKFENFLADMGPCPSAKHSLSRLRDSGNYKVGNVVWGTPAHQKKQKLLKKQTQERKH